MYKSLVKEIIKEEKKIYLRTHFYLMFTRSKRYLIWKFLKYYRISQYHREQVGNTHGLNNICARIKYWHYSRKKNLFSEKCGIEIANGCKIGRRIRMWHGGIVINANLGDDCLLHGNNILGNKGVYPFDQLPNIGNNVDIGAGAVLIGNIHIADNCIIGANAVITKSFDSPGSVIVGVPGREIESD